MGVCHIPAELERIIEQRVAAGDAESAAAFIETAVLQFLEAEAAQTRELLTVVEAGRADMAAGRYVTVGTAEDERGFWQERFDTMRAQPD